MTLVDMVGAIRDALGEEMERDSDRRPARRGRRGQGRGLQGVRGSPRPVRAAAGARHASRRDRHRGGRHRRRHDGTATGGGIPVRRLHAPGIRPDRQPGGHDALAERGRVVRPRRLPGPVRRRQRRRHLPLAEPRGGLLPCPGPEGRGAGDADRRQGPAQGGHPGRRSGRLLRAQTQLPDPP